MGMIDMTGKQRSDEDIKEAIVVVKTIMVKQPMVLPSFTLQAGIIKDGLEELLRWRKLVSPKEDG